MKKYDNPAIRASFVLGVSIFQILAVIEGRYARKIPSKRERSRFLRSALINANGKRYVLGNKHYWRVVVLATQCHLVRTLLAVNPPQTLSVSSLTAIVG
jgi:hypothetical protein